MEGYKAAAKYGGGLSNRRRKMLIGNVLEKTNAVYAWQLCADKLADRVRDIWFENSKQGQKMWEEAISEDENALTGLCKEGFSDLVGLDYIFKWWGAEDSDQLAGEIDVIWKVADAEDDASISCYRSWVKLAERDFILGLYGSEPEKREANRKAFRAAFTQWRELFCQKRTAPVME